MMMMMMVVVVVVVTMTMITMMIMLTMTLFAQVLHNRVSHPGVYDFADNHDGSIELPLLQHLASAECKYTGVVVMNAIHRCVRACVRVRACVTLAAATTTWRAFGRKCRMLRSLTQGRWALTERE